MGTYLSSSLWEGAINTETFTAGTPVTILFTNKSNNALGTSGYFTVVASGSTYSFNSDAYNSGPVRSGDDILLSSATTNPTDQNPLIDPNLTFVPSTSGGGSGVKINVTFTGGAGVSTLTSCNVLQGFQGSGYAIGDTLTIPAAQLNAKSGGSGTTDLIFTLERKDIIPQFDQSSQANVSGDFYDFSDIFIQDFPAGNVRSGSSLIQSSNKWSISVPNGPFTSKKLTWRPANNIGPGALTYYGTGHFEVKI